MSYVVQTKQLTKMYRDHHAVKNLELKVEGGDIYGFLGPNGAGKTTTIRMLLGLIGPSQGTIEIFGKEFARNRISILQHIGSLVESPSYYGKLTAKENLRIVQKILGVDEKNIEDVLKIVQLTKTKNKLVKEFSLGMKQRLGIAMALLGRPKLLILDEPTNGLDPSGIQEMRELIKDLPKKYGITVIVSSHLLSEIDQIATKVGVINEGELVFQDSIQKLRQQNHASLELRVSDINKAHHILLNRQVQTKVNNERLLIPPLSDDMVGEINTVLIKNQISVYRIEERKLSLEQIFLNLIKKGRGIS
ncbi:ABC transporter ATP-binding protein [Bacillus subtilis]|nr:ABC transporter ATP-binding protein [Bacillus subtilis]MDM5300293.1 ABC transporter ATP-binding protein [Bacillus subtilis]MDM5322346.1 ABC transporter ATP-binding protein [Bacillus subtilis]